jgi:hypothetical protein
VSDRFWRKRLGTDPHVLGHQLTLDQSAFTIAGVMPPGFRGADQDEQPDVFIPFQLEPVIDAPFDNIKSGWRNWWFQVGARPGREDLLVLFFCGIFLSAYIR